MALSAAEQYMLELINRARLDPLGEAARLGIGLNDNLSQGQLHSGTRGVLAPEVALELAASLHSQWMLSNDIFSHTGVNNTSPSQRAIAAGYQGYGAGENISWRGNTGSMNLETAIGQQHADLFRSAGHRVNILYDSYREIGVAQEAGQFTYSGTAYNASMVTQNFSSKSSIFYVTGVVYSDSDGDRFYSIGEGRGGANLATAGDATTSATAGGYALQAVEGGPVLVTGTVSGKAFSVRIVVDGVNAKLDVVNGTTVAASADVTLVSGLQRARLLGSGAIDATGNGAANTLEGNAARNVLTGNGGADRLIGQGGNDVLVGGAGNDRLTGGAGTDAFVFRAGAGDDTITDFASTDRLRLDDAIWGGSVTSGAAVVVQYARIVAGDVVIDLGAGHELTLDGVSSLSGLAARIDII